jgi:hypothetical protein
MFHTCFSHLTSCHQSMKLLVIQFSPRPCYLRCHCSDILSALLGNRPSFTPIHYQTHLQNYTRTNLGLRNTALGNRMHVQHRNTRTLPVEGSAHDNGRTMACAGYGNMEGSPNPNR